jgi:hypothetical protein
MKALPRAGVASTSDTSQFARKPLRWEFRWNSGASNRISPQL